MDAKELFISVKLMRSNYGEIYYIDYGIFVKRRWKGENYKIQNPYSAEIRSRIDGCEITKYDAIKYEEFLKNQIACLFSDLTTELALKKKIAETPSDFLLMMPLEERQEWSPIWRD